MDFNHVLNNMLDYDTYLRNVLDDVTVDENVHQPPMYNILKSFQSILQTNINNVIHESRLRNNEKTLEPQIFHSKIHLIVNKREKECSICLETIKEEQVCSCLPCLHTFHEGCVKRWLTMNKSTCPECRLDI